MTNQHLSLFASTSNAMHAAEAVRELINASPRTPTAAEIAATIEEHMGPKARPSISICKEAQAFVDLQRELIAFCREYETASAAERATFDHAKREATIDDTVIKMSILAKAILARPIVGMTDLVERAIVGAEFELDREGDTYSDLSPCAPVGQRALAQIAISLQALAGGGPNPTGLSPTFVEIHARWQVAKARFDDSLARTNASADVTDEECEVEDALMAIEREGMMAPAQNWADVAFIARLAQRHAEPALQMQPADFAWIDEMAPVAVLRAALSVGGQQ